MMKLSHGLCPTTADSRTERSLSEISSPVLLQCAPAAVRGSNSTAEESQTYFGDLTATL